MRGLRDAARFVVVRGPVGGMLGGVLMVAVSIRRRFVPEEFGRSRERDLVCERADAMVQLQRGDGAVIVGRGQRQRETCPRTNGGFVVVVII